MNLEQIKYLAEINRCHSLRQAGEQLHVTAQALKSVINLSGKRIKSHSYRKFAHWYFSHFKWAYSFRCRRGIFKCDL